MNSAIVRPALTLALVVPATFFPTKAIAVQEPQVLNFSASMANKTSITCLMGKTTKKITGVNPKCPTGYIKRNQA